MIRTNRPQVLVALICSSLMPLSLMGLDLSPEVNPASVLFWTSEQQLRYYPAMETLYPVHVVHHGSYVHPLTATALPITPRYQWEGRTWTLDDYLQAYRVSGLLVLKDGRIVLERYALGRKPSDRWTSFSVAKSVTSLLAGAAIQDGKLALEDTVARYVPELKGSAYEEVTVRQLLMMSSGVKWVEDYTDANSDIVLSAKASAKNSDGFLSYLHHLPRENPAGTRFHYNTAETHLAGLVIARAVGQTLADYLSEKIWKPYGMEHDAVWAVDSAGHESAGCCLSMTLRDYGRLGQFVLDGGVARGKPIEPPNWIFESTRVQIANDQPAPAGYGYFWWIGARAFEASGIFGQSILIYPKERLVIVINSAWPKPVAPELFQALSMFQGAIHDAAAPDFPKTLRQ